MDDKLKAAIDKELDKAAAEQERCEQNARRDAAAVNHADALAEACIAAMIYLEPHARDYVDAKEVYEQLRAARATYVAAKEG